MNKNNVGILLAVLGVGFAVIGYFVIFQRFTEQRDTLAATNATLQEEVDHLQDLADHKQEYLDETANMKAQNEEIMDQFPPEIRTEDEILHIKDTENAFGVVINSVSMPESAVVEVARPVVEEAAPAGEEVAEEPAAEDGEVVEETAEEAPPAPQVMLYRTPVSCSIETSYSAIKDLIDQFAKDEIAKKSIENLSLNFSAETGELTGALSYSMYSLTGTDKVYQEPSVGGIPFGTSDFFNSVARGNAIAAQRAADAAENEAQENSAEQ